MLIFHNIWYSLTNEKCHEKFLHIKNKIFLKVQNSATHLLLTFKHLGVLLSQLFLNSTVFFGLGHLKNLSESEVCKLRGECCGFKSTCIHIRHLLKL